MVTYLPRSISCLSLGQTNLAFPVVWSSMGVEASGGDSVLYCPRVEDNGMTLLDSSSQELIESCLFYFVIVVMIGFPAVQGLVGILIGIRWDKVLRHLLDALPDVMWILLLKMVWANCCSELKKVVIYLQSTFSIFLLYLIRFELINSIRTYTLCY